MDWTKIIKTDRGRRIFYIDIGDMPPCKANQFIERMRKVLRERRNRKPKFEVDFIE